MAFVFKDKDTGQILRVDYGKPDPDIYAQKEGLQNWEAIEMTDDEAEKLLPSGKGDSPAVGVLTLEERIRRLEIEVFKI